MRPLLLVFLALLSGGVPAETLREPLGGSALMALLDSPDADKRLAGAYYIYGVLEGHIVSATRPLAVCILDEPVTLEDLVTTVRNYYAKYPFLLFIKMAPEDIVLALQKRYPCKPEP